MNIEKEPVSVHGVGNVGEADYPPIDKYCRIRNRHSGKYLHVSKASKANFKKPNKNKMVKDPKNGISRPENWSDVPGSILQWGYNQRGVDFDDHFLFLLIRLPDTTDSYYIFNKRSGRGWHVAGASMDNGGVIAQYDYRDRHVDYDDHFIFKLQQVEKAFYIKNKRSGKYLHVAGASMDNGGNIAQWDHERRGVDYDDHFMFELKRVDDNDTYYYIVNKRSGKYLHVAGASMDNKGNIAQWDHERRGVDYDDHFMFELEPANDAFYIVNMRSRKYLHVIGASMDNGGVIAQYDYRDRHVDYDDHFIFEFEPENDKIYVPPEISEEPGAARGKIPAPKSGDEGLPEESPPVTIAQGPWPFIWVNDEEFHRPQDQLEDIPYYQLRHVELYKRVDDKTYPRDTTLNESRSNKVVLSRTDSESIKSTFGWKGGTQISAGVKGKFSASAKISAELHKEVTTSRESSETKTHATEVAYTLKYEPRSDPFRIVTWAHCDRYTLTKPDGREMLVWEMIDEDNIIQKEYTLSS